MGNSKYVAGGRTYFEVSSLASNIVFFTTKGFFDKLGYVEPPGEDSVNLGLILGLTFGGLALIGLIIFFICYKRKQSAKIKDEHID